MSDSTGEPFQPVPSAVPPPLQTEDRSHQYWKAATSCLPTPEKREAAWDFYLHHLAEAQSADIFGGLILLLEAHNAILLQVPDKFHELVFTPFSEQLSLIKRDLAASEGFQARALSAWEEAILDVEKFALVHQSIAKEMEKSITRIVREIDLDNLKDRITGELQEKVLMPYCEAGEKLKSGVEQIKTTALAAEESVAAWREMNLKWFPIATAVLTLFLAGGAFMFGWQKLEQRYTAEMLRASQSFEDAIASQLENIEANQKTLQELTILGASLEIVNASHDGRAVPGHFALILHEAVNATIRKVDGKQQGIVYFQTKRSASQIQTLRKEIAARSKEVKTSNASPVFSGQAQLITSDTK